MYIYDHLHPYLHIHVYLFLHIDGFKFKHRSIITVLDLHLFIHIHISIYIYDHLNPYTHIYIYIHIFIYHISFLRIDGFGFKHNSTLTVLDQVDGHKVGWPLGAILYEINSLPWEMEQPIVREPWGKLFLAATIGEFTMCFVWCYGAFFIDILVGFVVFLLCCVVLFCFGCSHRVCFLYSFLSTGL